MPIFAPMLRRKIIAVFLVLVFSIPLIPTVQVGTLLYQNQMNEEIPHGSADAPIKCNPLNEEVHKCFYHSLSFSIEQNTTVHSAIYIHSSERIPAFHVADIFVPPPNC